VLFRSGVEEGRRRRGEKVPTGRPFDAFHLLRTG